MTRINVVEPQELMDQHLLAEYRELPMVLAALRRSIRSKRGLPKIPTEYTLGKGHVTFFYDKGTFLYKRYKALKRELTTRGYRLDPNRKIEWHTIGPNLWKEYDPTPIDVAINRVRIAQRIMKRPNWYRYYGKPNVTVNR